MPNDANFDIAGKFVYETTHLKNFISLRQEKFTFTKTRILFSPSQKDRFSNKLNADPINLSCPLVDNTHYSLLTKTVNDKTVYLIEIGDTNLKCKATLHLDTLNLFRLKLVHNLELGILPKWVTPVLGTVIKKWAEIFAVFIASLISFKIGSSKTDELNSNVHLLNTRLDTMQQEIKALHDSVHRLALHSIQNTENEKNVSYIDTTKQKTQTK